MSLSSYSIQLVAALAKLHPLSCCQFRLQAALFIQQVCDQNINQVRTAGGREDLNLCLIENSVFKENRRKHVLLSSDISPCAGNR